MKSRHIENKIKGFKVFPFIFLFLFSQASIATTVNQIAPRKMVKVKGGQFSPPYFLTKKSTNYKVNSFFIDETLVTNQDYLKFVKVNQEWRKSKIPDIYHDGKYLSSWQSDLNYLPGKANQPVTSVSWFAARAYCKSQGKRLPTELEWEFAAYEKNSDKLSWYWQPQVSPIPEIKKTKNNRIGIYDFHNLAWEWIDDFGSIIMNSDNRTSGGKQEIPAFCGSTGNFKDKSDYAAFVRYSLRSSMQGSYTLHNMGFRCAK